MASDLEKIGKLPETERARAYLRTAYESYHAGSYTEVLELTHSAMEAGVDDLQLLFLRGDSLSMLSRAEEAKTVLLAVVRRDPEHAFAKYALARASAKMDPPETTLGYFESYLATPILDKYLHREVLIAYGRVLRSARKYTEAADLFTMLLEQSPHTAVLYTELSKTLFRLKKRQQGKFLESIYKQIVGRALNSRLESKMRQVGTTASLLVQQGGVFQRQRDYVTAYTRFRDASMLQGNDSRAAQAFCQFLLRFSRTTEASAALDQAMAANATPQSGLWYWRGMLETQLENYDTALIALGKCIDTSAREGSMPTGSGQLSMLTVRMAQAKTLYLDKQDEVAATILEELKREKATSWRIPFLLSLVRYRQGKIGEAINKIGEALALEGGTDPTVQYWRAILMASEMPASEAISALAQAVHSRPFQKDAIDALLKRLPEDDSKRRSIIELEARNEAGRGKLAALRTKLQETAFDACGKIYTDIGLTLNSVQDRSAQNFLFLASDLDVSDLRATRQLILRMTNGRDVFARLFYYRRVLSREPDDVDALYSIATIYWQLQVRWDEAEKLSTRLLRLVRKPSTIALRARITEARGDGRAAKRLAIEGLKEFPGNPELERITQPTKRP